VLGVIFGSVIYYLILIRGFIMTNYMKRKVRTYGKPILRKAETLEKVLDKTLKRVSTSENKEGITYIFGYYKDDIETTVVSLGYFDKSIDKYVPIY
jgi:hypothetical protein